MKTANLKIGQRLNIAFALSFAMLALVAGLGAARLAALGGDFDVTLNHHYRNIADLGAAQGALVLQSRHLSHALLQADAALARAEFDKADRLGLQAAAGLDAVGSRLRLPEAQALFGHVQASAVAYSAALGHVVQLARASQNEQAGAALLATFSPAQRAYLDAIDSLSDFHAGLMRANGERAVAAATLASRAMVALGVVGGVLCMLTAWYITRGIVGPIRHAVKVARMVASGDLSSNIEVRSSDEVGQLSAALKEMNGNLARIVGQVRGATDTIALASGEIAAGNQDLSSRTEQQASTLEETAASMEQLTGTVRQNAENARLARELAQSASKLADQGGAVVEQVVAKMASINEGSRKMTDIIGVIDSIAFQTNILALNAAVEAARAGEQGRGFAVVASEVRNLAKSSAAAARDIGRLIGDATGEVDAGAKLAGRAGRRMADIVGSISRVTVIVGEIADASAEQLAGIVHVNAALAQIDQATGQNAALVEEAAAAAAAAMRHQAGDLSRAVDIFTLASAPAVHAGPGRSGVGTIALAPPPPARKNAKPSGLGARAMRA
ncbi:methyl-accepting chemotaxis protein [Massilia psychrophila]|uniref:Methyl-accepting chemotaxis protein n=1 Tax=Massilia psychrophila TaxID=1603353 RepID=A0A2G8T2J1_9BURK|nr:methyl-accepting chemotaxis protein [Massilia psychrophila]PIL40212.1 methyl-accepting chemotaxis protein [Massilia psychrophila]GGE75926.1 methyl-accepting chemotaxis protein [Massilia psychrophila]